MICFPSPALSLFLCPPHVCYCCCWPRCCYAHCQRVSWPGPLGATPKGVGRRTRKEQPNRTSQDRTGHRTQHSEWNGTERNRTKPNQDQTRTKADRTEANRSEHRPVECIKCWPKLQPAHISHESVCQVKSPSPLIPHNNNNDNPPCGAHSVCVLTMTKC